MDYCNSSDSSLLNNYQINKHLNHDQNFDQNCNTFVEEVNEMYHGIINMTDEELSDVGIEVTDDDEDDNLNNIKQKNVSKKNFK